MYIIIADINVHSGFEILNNLYIDSRYIIISALLFYDTAIFTVVFKRASTKIYIADGYIRLCIKKKYNTSIVWFTIIIDKRIFFLLNYNIISKKNTYT